MVLMVTAPLVLAYCVSPPEEMLKATEPSDWPLTVTLLMVMPEPLGEVSEPSAAKVKACPVLTQPTAVPVAFGSVW